jgi:phosphatidate phosphatase APP1
VLDAYGQWRSSGGEIRVLPNHILVVLYPSTPQAEAAIEAIRQEFKTQFNQVSVLRATTPTQIAF